MLKGASRLDEDRLVYGLVRNTHVFIIGKRQGQFTCYLFRRPVELQFLDNMVTKLFIDVELTRFRPFEIDKCVLLG